jgi:hypothetical protein
MALRLSYDDIKVEKIEPDLEAAIKAFATIDTPNVVLATYTAMMDLYKILTKTAETIE